MNELQVMKNGYVRLARTVIAVLFGIAGGLLQWLEPALSIYLLFYLASAVILFPVLRDAFAVLGYKKVIAAVYGRQEFWGPFFGGEPLGELRLRARDARMQIRDLRFDAIHTCGYDGEEFDELLANEGFATAWQTIAEDRRRLEQKVRSITLRAASAGLGPYETHGLLIRLGIEETELRIAMLEEGISRGLPPQYVFELLMEKGVGGTEKLLKYLDEASELLGQAEKLGSQDVILTALKQFGYEGAKRRLEEIKTGHSTPVK